MATINIQTQNDNTIKAIKALLLLDPTATIVCDEPMLSESDQKKLDEIIDRSDKGELKLYNDDEIKASRKKARVVILYSENFVSELENIASFIALHSEARADDFMRELKSEIEKIPFMPYRFRKNLKQNKNDIREMIFKSYVVPFQIKKDSIIILSIFKCNLTRFS